MKRAVGKKKTAERQYAEHLGITLRKLNDLGGMEKLMRCSDEARAVLINSLRLKI